MKDQVFIDKNFVAQNVRFLQVGTRKLHLRQLNDSSLYKMCFKLLLVPEAAQKDMNQYILI